MQVVVIIVVDEIVADVVVVDGALVSIAVGLI